MTLRISFCAVLAGFVLLPLSTADAQRSTPADIQPGDVAPRRAVPKPIDVAKELAALPPNLRAALEQWHQASEQVQKLHGEHCRFVYDYTFGVEKRAVGKFYYEAPSRGRIDLAPKVPAQKKAAKRHPETGGLVQFNVRPDVQERWICDGTQILAIDDSQKTVQQYPIPEKARGENIMDGPLPFLFGMPPEKAVARYKLRLEGVTARHFDLLAVPRWKQDAANYKWARIRIERKTMLPMAVQMMDPAGTRETVYTFPKVEKNPTSGLLTGSRLFQKIFGTSDPFRPNLKGYELQAAQIAAKPGTQPGAAGPPGPTVPRTKGPVVPSVIGLSYKRAEEILKLSGYNVKFYRGEPAANEQLKFRVAKQDPGPRDPLEKGQLVKVTLYIDPVQQIGGTAPAMPAPAATVSRAGTPNVVGLAWTEAEKLLTAQGLVVKFRRGRAAVRESDIFRVYDQSPKEGAAIAKGGTILLTLFTKPGETKPAPAR